MIEAPAPNIDYFECSRCFSRVGPGVAYRTKDRYGYVYCVDCGVMVGQAEIDRLKTEELL